ncbi:hypothetical protein OWT26_25965 [Burkholderia sp. 1A5]
MRLDALNAQSMALTGVPTKYRPEQPYNMKANPPIPMMDDEAPLEPVSNLRRWINQFWPGGRKEYKAGAGYIRRPDVVIVNDPSQPPNQSNLERVVEMKFLTTGMGRTRRTITFVLRDNRASSCRSTPAIANAAASSRSKRRRPRANQHRSPTETSTICSAPKGRQDPSVRCYRRPPYLHLQREADFCERHDDK